MTIHFVGGAQNGPVDGCLNRSHTWIDQVYLAESSQTAVGSPHGKQWKIYPNPAGGRIHLSGDTQGLQRFEICNMLGKTLQEGPVKGSSIEIRPTGYLMLVLETEDGDRTAYKFINR